MKNIGQKRTKAPFLLCYEFPVTTFLKTKCIYKLKQRVILHVLPTSKSFIEFGLLH